jgi:hypothetical protein
MSVRWIVITAVVAAAVLSGCADTAPLVISSSAPENMNAVKASKSKSDASAIASFVDFEFDGELITSSCWNAESAIETQMLYSVGQLNGNNSVGRLDKLDIQSIDTSVGDGQCTVKYHARILVAWGREDVPESYELMLPRDVRMSGQEAFMEKYKRHCVSPSAHDLTPGIFWYYYRPSAFMCEIEDADVVRIRASVHPSPIHTTGKYPEYHEVWKDDVLEVVAVFGKYKDGATSGDAGITAYNRFLRDVTGQFHADSLVTTPEDIPMNPGVETPEVIFEAAFDDGRRVRVVAILIDSVGSADSTFWNRYEELTPKADLIVYNGHAGLGANIRKLASRGEWIQGQYAIVFMNGCDTYAYIDSALAEAHAEVNPDDPEGTKYVDIVANAMPSFFRSMSAATMALIRGLVDVENPRTYEQIFTNIDSYEVVLVTGEHDNVYVPGYGESDSQPTVSNWAGLNEQGAVADGEEVFFDTVQLPAGRYSFDMAGDGDADLYVRVGDRPSTDVYDCRPFMPDSAESCEVVVDTPVTVHVMIRGTAAAPSRFELIGEQQ